jgi:GT2 family glycosyltransferase
MARECVGLNPVCATIALGAHSTQVNFGRDDACVAESASEPPIVNEAHYATLNISPFFEKEWYLEANPDVRDNQVDPIIHYLVCGAREGRCPSRIFDPEKYLKLPNVVTSEAVDNPLIHFLTKGIFAGAAESFLAQAQQGEPLWQYADEPPSANVAAYTGVVDIIICVHNALDEVKQCVRSLFQQTTTPFELILVDDGSDDKTSAYLNSVASITGARLFRNENAKGYTHAANIGLSMSKSEYCVLLNSDTEVTFGWLDNMLRYMQLESSCGIVGPLSNTASWQSVPKIFDGEDWAENELPDGWTSQEMANIVASNSTLRGIPLGFLNGFCMLLRRSMLQQIGSFDEETFGAGYGEENDLCIRARKQGWRLIVADDVYVYHRQSRSYGNERRRVLALTAGRALEQKYSHAEDIGPYVQVCIQSQLLQRTRLRISSNQRRAEIQDYARRRFELKRCCFILPVADAGGGANVIIQEIKALRRFGIDAWIFNDARFASSFERAYPRLDIPVAYFATPDPAGVTDLINDSLPFDAIIATSYSSFALLPSESCHRTLCYYVQDFEPWFFTQTDGRRKLAESTYSLRPEVLRVTKTKWNREAVRRVGGIPPKVLGASIDVDRFYPISDERLDTHRVPFIAAMVRPETPRRAPVQTLEIMRRVIEKFGTSVKTAIFGASSTDIASLGIAVNGTENYGPLSADSVARVLRRADIFLDLSEWQAMGLTALEAMASGVAVVGPKRGGFAEYASNGLSALLIDTQDEAECFTAVERLVNDIELRKKIMSNAMTTAADLYPEKAALALCHELWGPL